MKVSKRKISESVRRILEGIYSKGWLLTRLEDSMRVFKVTAPEMIDRWLSYRVENPRWGYPDLTNNICNNIWYIIEHESEVWDEFIDEISGSYDINRALYSSNKLKRERNSNPRYEDPCKKIRDDLMNKLDRGGVFENNKFNTYDALIKKLQSCGFREISAVKGKDSKIVFDDYLKEGFYVYILVSRNYERDYFDWSTERYVKSGKTFLYLMKSTITVKFSNNS